MSKETAGDAPLPLVVSHPSNVNGALQTLMWVTTHGLRILRQGCPHTTTVYGNRYGGIGIAVPSSEELDSSLVRGQPVKTCVHPTKKMCAVRVEASNTA